MICSAILRLLPPNYGRCLVAAGFAILMLPACGPDKTVVFQIIDRGDFPSPVSLIIPPNDTLVNSNHPSFIWHEAADVIQYQLQVSSSDAFVSRAVDIHTRDTSYTALSSLADNTYYWRVRSCDVDGAWGNWAEAEIRFFYKSNYADYVELLSQTLTYGSPQDVFIRGDTAYVADGQSFLTIFDISNPYTPQLLRNLDPRDDDFAKGIFVPSDTAYPYIYLADMDGMIRSISVTDTSGVFDGMFGSDLNTEDITGVTKPDSLGQPELWVLSVSSSPAHRKLSVYQMIAALGGNGFGYSNYMLMPSDALGLCYDSNYVYVACGDFGLVVIDFHDPFNMLEASSLNLPGRALSVDAENGLACVAADRAGCNIVDIRNPFQPRLIKNINTAGRSKDVRIVGDYLFVADGGSGLKVIDISIPDSAYVVATYHTNYAYGLWADVNFIYLCDRDLGLMIFENRTTP